MLLFHCHICPKIETRAFYYLLICLTCCWMSGKQCRPWSGDGFCGVWSGSTLFAQACLSQHLGLLWCSVCEKCNMPHANSRDPKQHTHPNADIVGDQLRKLMLRTLGIFFSADDILKYFSIFSQAICMECQILFSGKNKKNITILSSAELAQRVVKWCALRENNIYETFESSTCRLSSNLHSASLVSTLNRLNVQWM